MGQEVLEDRIRHQFEDSIANKVSSIDILSPLIAKASAKLADVLLNEGKILVCGNGGSAANAIHFSTAMMYYFEAERPPLPVLSLATEASVLTALPNDSILEQHYARQIQAYGKAQDILLIFSTTGNQKNILYALQAAHDVGMDVMLISGRDGGLLSNHLGPDDLEIRVTGSSAAKIREVHLFIIHCFCDVIDYTLFGSA